MLKKIIYSFLILVFGFLINSDIFWASLVSVENVFIDITKDYVYYDELQTLYDKWIIEPEIDNKFHPDKLLNRDEFVWIAEETSCKKCIQPNVDKDFIDKYDTEPFFDVWINNKYFYCISDAKENAFVLGYDKWVKCNDWTQKNNEIPFCTNNNIKLEEALAVVMRMWWILTDEQAKETIKKIEDWKTYPDLALDMKALNIDGEPNSFYPYFKKALEYEVIDYDNLWNKKTYKLVELKWGYLRPSQLITKQDFLKMAYIALKANSCITEEVDSLAIKINIYDKSCDEIKAAKWECSLWDLKNNFNIFDFDSDVWWICEKWIDEKNWYIWRFYNIDTWKQTIKYWKYIDNYKFLESWDYRIFLRVTDKCWNTWEVYNTLSIGWESIDNWLWLDVIADKIYWKWPLDVKFNWVIDWWEWPYVCSWDYWDWNIWEWEDTSHVFDDVWIYEVVTICTDSNWLSSQVTTVIKVVESTDNNSDIGLWLDVVADKVYWELPLEVNFDWIVDGWVGPYTFTWDYWDWSIWEWEDTTHVFNEAWVYEVITIVTDSNWLTSQVTTVIKVVESFNQNVNLFDVSINANPISWDAPLEVDFEALINGWIWPYEYIWNFADWSSWNWNIIKHVFIDSWVYEVQLKVIDNNWNISEATVLIKVGDPSENSDFDNDWIPDNIDKCPTVFWVEENDWCPIFTKDDWGWWGWWWNGWWSYSNLGDCLLSQENSWFIFWNIVCDSCPCDNYIDFRATLRDCDTVIPAITSVDEKTIYSRWNLFQIRK